MALGTTEACCLYCVCLGVILCKVSRKKLPRMLRLHLSRGRRASRPVVLPLTPPPEELAKRATAGTLTVKGGPYVVGNDCVVYSMVLTEIAKNHCGNDEEIIVNVRCERDCRTGAGVLPVMPNRLHSHSPRRVRFATHARLADTTTSRGTRRVEAGATASRPASPGGARPPRFRAAWL